MYIKFFLLEDEMITGSIPQIVVLGVAVLVLITFILNWLYRYFTAVEELDIEGSFIEITDTEIPIVVNQPYIGEFSMCTAIPASTCTAHEYGVVIKNAKGEKIPMKIESTFVQKVKEHLQIAGSKMKIHCERTLWNNELKMKFIYH